MLDINGEAKLRQYAENGFSKQVLKVSDSVYHVMSYGHSNSIVIIADESVILIDALNSLDTGQKLKEVVAYAPLEQLVLETDSPYLSPEPNRGKRNSSLNLSYVAVCQRIRCAERKL